MDLVKKNEDFIVLKRSQLREKSLKNLQNMIQAFENEIGKEKTPLEKEMQKV